MNIVWYVILSFIYNLKLVTGEWRDGVCHGQGGRRFCSSETKNLSDPALTFPRRGRT